MERSQRRYRRNKDSLADLSFTRPAIIVAATIAAVGAVWSLGNQHTADDDEILTRAGCTEKSLSIPDCLAPNATANLPASVIDGSPRKFATELETGSRERTRSPRRAWQQHDPASTLLPGQTLVEVCDSSSEFAISHCRAHTTAFLTGFSPRGTGHVDDNRLSISGHVVSAAGRTLEGVSIVAMPERLDDGTIALADNLRFWTVTDTLGAYSFSSLPAGEYTVRSTRHGPYEPVRISVRTGVDYADLIVPRSLELVLKGRVVGRFDEPLEGVTVFPTLLGQASVQTRLDGRFELPVTVRPGVDSLTLQFQMPGYKDKSSRVEIVGYTAAVTEEVRVVMDTVESWASLEGIVTNDAGQPLAGRVVELKPEAGRRMQSTTTDKAGRYAFAFVESPADYRLLLAGGEGFKDIERDVHVTTQKNEINLTAEAYQTGAVSGQLVNQDGAPIPEFELVLKNQASRRPNAVVRTDSNGNFEIPEAPAGDLVISSRSTPSVLIKGLHLRPGEDVYLPMVLDWGGHSIRGQVVDPSGNPVPASRVVLNWSNHYGDLHTQTTRRTATDSLGRFAFSNLGSGPHSLKVNAPGFIGIDIDHDLSRQGYDLMVRLN